MSALIAISFALAAATTPAEPGERVLFKQQKPLLEKGQLAAHTAEALAGQAKRIGGDQLTLTICLGLPDSPPPGKIAGLAGTATRALKEALPKAHVTWVAQELEESECPRGMILANWRVPSGAEVSATLQPLGGTIHVKLPSGKGEEAAAGSRLPIGTVLETESGGRCAVRFDDGLIVRLGVSSRIKIDSLRPSSRLTLSLGRIWVWATASEPAHVETPHGVVELPPGHYRVAVVRDKVELVRVESLVGTARLLKGKERWEVEAGFGGTLRGDEVVTGMVLPPPPSGLLPVHGEQAMPLTLTWKPVEEASKYHVWIATDVRFNHIAFADMSQEPEMKLAGLEPGEYFWRVTTLDGRGYEGAPSQLFRLRLTAAEAEAKADAKADSAPAKAGE